MRTATVQKVRGGKAEGKEGGKERERERERERVSDSSRNLVAP